MKIRSSINIALIALMLFSQVISSVHVVGHLHAPDLHAMDECSLDDVASIAHASQASTAAFSAAGHAEHHVGHGGHAGHSDHAEHAVHTEHVDAMGGLDTDCLIYHAYTNLSGFVPLDSLHSSIQTIISVSFPLGSRHVSVLALDTRRIRGPPLLS